MHLDPIQARTVAAQLAAGVMASKNFLTMHDAMNAAEEAVRVFRAIERLLLDPSSAPR